MLFQITKRITDVIISTTVIILLIPFYPFIALAIKINSKGPAIIKLDRISLGKTVKVYKFRTMIKNAHILKKDLLSLNERSDGPFFKIKNDPRITKIGKILRKLRIDEFPQLINVLKGELSLVGPRPHEPEETVLYPEKYKSLISEKSGITGLSQVNGASGLPFLKELEFDDYYAKHKSLTFDLKILLKTIYILLFDPTGV